MTQEAISARRRTRALKAPPALRDALLAFALSRALVWAAAVAAVYVLPIQRSQERAHDVPALTGALGRALGALARWDGVWYLTIAHSGYGAGESLTAFFPLYPLSVRAAAGGWTSPPLLLAAAYLVSAVSFVVALVLLRKLVELELGERYARPVLLLAAFWPASFFFSAPYSESLFLALSVGVFYAARTGRWPLAAALCAAATAARPTGLLLILPLALMAWRARQLRWLALAPLGAAAFSAGLAVAGLRAFGWFHVERVWGHVFKGPAAGVWDATVAGVRGVGQVFGSAPVDRVVAAENVLYLVLLVLALIALAGMFRRLPPAYGLYTAASLAAAVSAPIAWQPLMSFGRLLAVVFPIPMWVALELRDRRFATAAALAASMALLVCGTALFATWQLVT
ncbi:MAG TPA: mannosyltransferase family protein [Thermoleophilaceae bacterium]|nr:mannosyltransferase family protein [Thermoleophilaceae bacterium]